MHILGALNLPPNRDLCPKTCSTARQHGAPSGFVTDGVTLSPKGVLAPPAVHLETHGGAAIRQLPS